MPKRGRRELDYRMFFFPIGTYAPIYRRVVDRGWARRRVVRRATIAHAKNENARHASFIFIGSGFPEILVLNRRGVEGNEFIDSRLTNLRCFGSVEQSNRSVGGL